MPDPQVQIPLAGGPNETIDPRQLPPGSVIAVRNAVYDADGSYQPRLGYTALTGAANPAGVQRLYAHGSELLARDAANLWTWDAQGSNWVPRDSVPPLLASYDSLQNTSSSYVQWDAALYQNYRVVSWIDAADNLARVGVYNTTTGACVLSPTTLAASTTYARIAVGIVGTTAILVASAAASAAIDAYALALAPIGSVSAVTHVDAGDVPVSGAPFAATFLSTTWVLAYEHAVSGSQSSLVLRSFSAALALQTTGSTTLTNGTHGMGSIAALGTPGENLWVAATFTATAYASNVLVLRADPSTLAFSAGPFAMTLAASITLFASLTFAAKLAIERLSASTCLVVASLAGNQAFGPGGAAFMGVGAINWQSYTVAGAASIASAATNCWLATAPCFDTPSGMCFALAYVLGVTATLNGRQMVAGAASPVQQVLPIPGSYVLITFPVNAVAATSPDHWATLAPQIAPTWTGVTTGIYRSSPRVQATTAGYEAIFSIARGTARQGLSLLTLARAPSLTIGATLGREMYIDGHYYDRVRLVEHGFVHAPRPPSAVDQSGAPTNSYEYVVTFARIDGAGNLEESAPSLPVFEVSSSPPNVNVTVTPIHLTRRQRLPSAANAGAADPIYILVYRSQALENGDNTLHLSTVVPYPVVNQNLLTTDQIVIADTTSDATLATLATLYTVGGELQHDAPEQLHGVIAHFNRAWGIGADNRTVWFSQEYSDGFLPAWSLSFVVTIDDANDTISALASLYDKLLIFTRRRIYVLYGDGPSDAGTGAEWTLPPQRLPATSGCVDSRSVVFTPAGVMFMSERGIELVTPDLQVLFVGLPVSVTTAAFPICASATMAHNSSTVRFCLTTSDTFGSQAGGVLLLYDLRRERWSMHYLTAGGAAGNVAGAPCYASTYHPLLGFVEAHNLDQYGDANTAVIARENTTADPTPWLDFGLYFVPLSVELAWIKAGDLQGWQRVRRIRVLASYSDAHGLSLTLDYDYQAVGEVHAFSSNTIAGVVNGSWEQVRIIPARGKSEAIRLTLATTAPTSPQVLGSGRGGGFIGLAFEVRPAKGGYRNLGAAAKG